MDIDAAVPSLDGPAHLAGQFSGPDGAPVVFRLASQKPGPDGTPLRVEVDAGPSWPAGEFEGMLEGDAAGALTGLRLAGTATLTGTAPGENEPTPWRVAGPMTVDLDRAVASRGGVSARTGRTGDPGDWGRDARFRLAAPAQHRSESQTGERRRAHAPQGRGRRRAGARA